MKIRWTTSARRDFVAAIEFLRSDNLRLAKRLSNRVDAQLKMLSEYPLIGRESRAPETRELFIPRTRHLIVYRVRGGELEIVRLLHAAQDWPPEQNA